MKVKASRYVVIIVCALFLVLSTLVVGVWAANYISTNTGGKISFTAKNLYCQVTGTYAGTTSAKDPVTLRWDANSRPKKEDISSWSGNTDFNKDATEISLTITITNLSEEVGMNVSLALGENDTVKNSTYYTRTIKYTDNTGTENNYTTYGTVFSISAKQSGTFVITYTIPDTSITQPSLVYDYDFTLTSQKV